MAINRLQKYLFYLIVFLIPSNLGKHWIQNWNYVNGILVDYLIPTLYLTDILIVGLLGLWFIEKLKVKSEKLKVKRNNGIAKFISRSRRLKSAITLILLIAVYSLLFTKNPPASIYKLVKIIEFGLLIYWIKTYINIKKDIKNLILVLAGSIIWQSVLGILQWFKQGSVFGYWFFGEQPYNTLTPGIKLISFFGALKIPAYGTFPHSNILAGFLTLSLILIIYFLTTATFLYDDRYIKKFTSALLKSYWVSRATMILAVVLGMIALFLTFSYVAWVGFLIGLGMIAVIQQNGLTQDLPLQKIKLRRRLKSAIPIIILITVYCLLITPKFIDPSSLQRRNELNKIAIKMWLSSPILGVGLNNFIPRMEEFGQIQATYRFLQPVHNIYLLILAETGIIGEIGLIWLVWLIIKNRADTRSAPTYFIVFSLLLFLGLFDHYLITIQQGMLMTSLVLGLGLAGKRANQ